MLIKTGISKNLGGLRNFYPIGLARMQGLRDGVTKWRMSCSYEELGRDDSNMLEVSISKLDPFHNSAQVVCPEVIKVRINGAGCSKCVVGRILVFCGGFFSSRRIV